jgi:dihydrofolate reductase
MNQLTIVVACARNGAIGLRGTLPWNIPEDMAYFKRITMGHAVIMGRKTWESIPAKYRPLPGRTNLVVSRTLPPAWNAPRLWYCADLHAALAAARLVDASPMVIGGSSLYAEALPMATRIMLTEIDRDVEADAFFRFDRSEFTEAFRVEGDTQDVSFVMLERRP